MAEAERTYVFRRRRESERERERRALLELSLIHISEPTRPY